MQFDQDGHSEVQHQLLITLVHGTWARGFFRTTWTPRHDTDALCGLRKAVRSWLASAPNSTTSRTKSRRYFGPVQTRSL